MNSESANQRNNDSVGTGRLGETRPIPQYRLLKIILMFAWPAAWFSLLIYGIAPFFIRQDNSAPTWLVNLLWLLGNGAEFVVALIILRREGYRLTLKALRDRINWRWPNRWWKWLAIVGALVIGFGLTIVLMPLQKDVATTFPPPTWMPGHPLKEIKSLQDGYPDVNFTGNFLFLIVRFVILGFIGNMVGEELYYRGVLQPKMKGVFGKWAWVANGIGFTLKHAYYYWRLPYLWPGGLGLAFIFGPMGSLPMAILIHWVTNGEPFMLVLAIQAVLGWK